MRPATLLVLALGSAAASPLAACGSSASKGGFAAGDGGSSSSSGGPVGDSGTSSSGGDGPGSLTGDGGTSGPGDADAGSSPGFVYAHSSGTLYRLDPASKQIAVVGPMSGGCTQVIDLAIDSTSNAYVTTSTDLWKLDLGTAACTFIASGTYPNSLSFVPKGTLDPNVEALVGYVGSTYIRINTTTGAVTDVGALSGGYTSSGDIVSVIGGGTFLTVKGGPDACADCLLEVDPKTGDLVRDYGSVNHADVFGLAFWAGTAYGFDDAGQVFSIGWQSNALVTTDIPVPNPPPGLSFWGAGSTTSAPPMSADGGGIPTQ
jgi:hypothetical protein